jgi:exonuclease III
MSASDSSGGYRYEDEPPSKRSKTSGGGPTTFVTWNANGLVSRCVWNKDEVQRLLRETDPDVLCLQEVRLKALNASSRGSPYPNDYKSIKDTMEATVFYNYKKYWSLADSKYAGTCTLIHNRVVKSVEHFETAFSTKSALSLILQRHNLKREEVKGLCSSPEAVKLKKPTDKKQQTCLTSFFAPKKNGNNDITTNRNAIEHHPEGRFQFISFPNFDLINTYVPNNGTKEESFQRRRDWDQDMKEFLKNRQNILQKVNQQERPLIWCGDMNCANEFKDGTHTAPGTDACPANDGDGRGIYEWFKDEKKCFVAGQIKKLDPTRHPDDTGIPSFTTNERRRFRNILEQADLVDVWRAMHPDGIQDNSGKYKTEWDRPNWSWRGHLSKDGNAYASKYEGKGQRLDYFLLSPSKLVSDCDGIVGKCDILGYGVNREGHFSGSDHSAIILILKKAF